MLRSRGEALQAHKIHQGIHDTIVRLFEQDSDLVLHSNSIRTSMLYRFGQIDAAEKLIRQTFQIGLCRFGLRNGKTLYYMKVLARALARCGKLLESEHLLRINIQLCREVEGPFSEDFLDSMERLSEVLIDQKRLDEGKCLAMSVAEQLGASIGHKHHDTLYNLFLAASCVAMQGDLAESERQLRVVLEIQIRSFGEKDKHVYMCMKKLSSVLTDMGRDAEATSLLEKCHKGWAKLYGKNHRATLSSCRKLADNYIKLDRSEDAIALLQRNVDDARESDEKVMEELLRTISKLATTLLMASRYKEAAAYYEEFLGDFIEMYGWSHERTQYSVCGLSVSYANLERYDEFLALHRRTFDELRRIYGDEHPEFIQLLSWMAQLREAWVANSERFGGKKEGMNLSESELVDEPPTDADEVNVHGNAAAENVTLTEENWMGELFDFDLLEFYPPKITDLDVNAT